MKKWMKITLVCVAVAVALTIAFWIAPSAPQPVADVTTTEYASTTQTLELGMPELATTTSITAQTASEQAEQTQATTTTLPATVWLSQTTPGNTVTLSISAQQAYQNPQLRRPNRNPPMPPGGVILAPTQVIFTPGETVFNLLLRETRARGIHTEHVNNPVFNSAYIRAINNLYEFDFGELSGWVYRVNGVFMGMGVSQTVLQPGDVVELIYTLEMVTIS